MFDSLDHEPGVQNPRRPYQEPPAVAVIGERVRGSLFELGHLDEHFSNDFLQGGDGFVRGESLRVASREFQTSGEVLAPFRIPFGPIRVVRLHGDIMRGAAAAGFQQVMMLCRT